MDVSASKTFWSDARRRLIAKTLSNLFLLLIGASATGEAVGNFPLWVKIGVAGAIILSGVLAVVVMPDDGREDV